MKISVSLSEEDVEFLDREALSGVYGSRSAAVQAALRLLRESQLGDAYAQAFAEWEDSDDSEWERTVGDGIVSRS
ncbi:ribbon-helix-helix domain-containing protein [Microbacterium sp. STN6]|uniref:ribbon-helix-helix domain-containing protein n=1 Tax=Microbacterium sp. STN6 TaxID=2995588 RepID=UPI00226094B5|nr:ribbon-helix-helix domain-containing protein [Microbacterium sp. STN6]MCX7521981.1 ribbon-helix-helix domain-containing protein [Microbacterium sp. STN6]